MNSLGGLLDGDLRRYATHYEGGLVELPARLSWRGGATLACAALTAWFVLNALYGGAKALSPAETVLVQGTGGVSLFSSQFAKTGGAEVIAMTNGEKMGSLRPNMFEQSCAAASIKGTIAVISTRAGQSPGTQLPHTALLQTRRIMIGSRLQF